MNRRTRRTIVLFSALAAFSLACGLILWGLRDGVSFFYSPSEIAEKPPAFGRAIRVGGLVRPGAILRDASGNLVFTLTDCAADIVVSYPKDPPDLFRAGQGALAEGVLGPDGRLQATLVLARHDENYMPREVAKALKDSGHWKDPGAQAAKDPEEFSIAGGPPFPCPNS